MRELKVLSQTLKEMGGEPEVFGNAAIAHVAANGNRVLSQREVAGVTIQAEETSEALINTITVARGMNILSPIHLCMGIVETTGVQRIQTQLIVEEGRITDATGQEPNREVHQFRGRILVPGHANRRVAQSRGQSGRKTQVGELIGRVYARLISASHEYADRGPGLEYPILLDE